MTHTTTRLEAALAGLTAGAAGLGTASLVAGFSGRLRSPVFEVGDRVVDAVPSWLKDLAISWFGTGDKVALLIGIGSMLAVYAAVLGVVALRRSMTLGYIGAVLFGLVGALSAWGARGATPWWAAIPSVIGTIAVIAVLTRLAARAEPEEATAALENAPTHRRRFLGEMAGFAVVAGGLGLLGQRLNQRFDAGSSRTAVAATEQGKTAFTGVAPTAPEGAQAENAASFFTSNADFYRIDTALTVPQVKAESWELKVLGMVDTPITLTYDDLLNRELVESDITLTCVSNLIGGDLLGTARWTGIRLDDLLAEAGIASGADQIVGRSVDGYTCGFPVEALDGRDALVAIAMNGEPLPLEHGFPARLVVPGIYGYASATKWLTEIELTTFDSFDHYWVPRGYAALAPIKMQTRIDSPRGLDRIPVGMTAIGGSAWAQPIGIDYVEVRIDDEDWVKADMATEVSNSTWRTWSFIWDATPGRHTVTARAISNDGSIQTADRSEPLPDGATGHHSVVVLVDET